MFEELADAIERLDIAANDDELVEVVALRDRLDARIAEAVGRFDAGGWWGRDGSLSMTAWLRHHARMTRRGAQRLRTMAARLRSLPVCAEAYADGTLSGGQVEAILAVLDDQLVDVFAAHEAELVPYLVPLTVAGVSRAMGAWLARAKPEPSAPAEPERAVHLSRTLDDRYVVCDRRSTWCEGHHVVWVTDGGTTDLGNLVLLCCRHHHLLHQPGWDGKLRPDGTFEVTDPDGIVRATSPPRR